MPLSSLTPDEIDALYMRYWNGEKVAELIAEFGMNVTPGRFIKVFPPVQVEKCCPNCQKPMVQARQPRRTWPNPYTCKDCQHIEAPADMPIAMFLKVCVCSGCQAAREEADRRMALKTAQIAEQKLGLHAVKLVAFEQLTLMDKAHLMAVLLAMTAGDLVRPLDQLRGPSLTPYKGSAAALLAGMFAKELIIPVYEHSPATSFGLNGEDLAFDFESVTWRLNVARGSEHRLTATELKDAIAGEDYGDLPREVIESALEELAIEEVEAQVYSAGDMISFDVKVGAAARLTLTSLVRSFDAGRASYFTRKAVNDAHRFSRSGKAKNRQHANNSIPGNIERLLCRALAESWEVKNYGRPGHLDRSLVNLGLCEMILKCGDIIYRKAVGDAVDEIMQQLRRQSAMSGPLSSAGFEAESDV